MSYYVNHTVVCGYSESTRILLDSLVNERGGMDGEILVFAGGDRPQDLPAEVIWIDGDPTKESELDKVRLPFAATAIITGDRRLPNPQLADAVTILVAFTMRSYLDKQPNYRERATPVYVVAEILDTENIQHARKAGADEVIETRRIGYSMLAHAAFAHGSGAVLSDVASHGTHSVWFGRRPNDLDSPTFGVLVTTIKARTGATVIGVRDADGQVSLGPSDDLKVGADTAVVYLAREPVLEPLDG